MEVFLVAVVIVCAILLTTIIVAFKFFSKDYFEKIEGIGADIRTLRQRYTACEKSIENIGKASADALERAQELSNNLELLKALNKR